MSVGIIGCGQMGEALMAGMLASSVVTADDVVVTDTRQPQLDRLAAQYGVTATTDNRVGLACDTVLVALKPQVLPSVLSADADAVGADALVVSIAAGVSTASLDALLPSGPAIVRVMPNTPALVGRGVSVVSAGPRATEDHVATVVGMLESVGIARVLPEEKIDAVTALSGSGPAYVFLLAEAMAEAGVLLGLSREDAVALADGTVAGAGALLASGGASAAQRREQVTSPGGTTAAALRVLEQRALRAAVIDAVAAAAERARDLG